MASCVERMAREICESHRNSKRLALVGVHKRGVPLAQRIAAAMKDMPCAEVQLGTIDITQYRDDLKQMKVLPKLEAIQKAFNGAQTGGKKISLADLIVLGGGAAIEAAAKKAGHDVKVPFSPGRMDAAQAQTDVESFAALEPVADGFRNYVRKGQEGSAAELLVDRANLLTLTAPEMTVLIGGLRVLNANVGQAKHGVFTQRPETLTNDFFVNLLDMHTTWQKSAASAGVLEGRDGATGALKWTGTVVDLVFGSNSQLRALAEVYACSDAQPAFVRDFVAAWHKVMNLDRFDLA